LNPSRLPGEREKIDGTGLADTGRKPKSAIAENARLNSERLITAAESGAKTGKGY